MTTANKPLTISGVSDAAYERTGERYPYWRVRRTLDQLEKAGAVEMQRFGLYRMIDPASLPLIIDALQRGASEALTSKQVSVPHGVERALQKQHAGLQGWEVCAAVKRLIEKGEIQVLRDGVQTFVDTADLPAVIDEICYGGVKAKPAAELANV